MVSVRTNFISLFDMHKGILGSLCPALAGRLAKLIITTTELSEDYWVGRGTFYGLETHVYLLLSRPK